ncbi:MAG: HD domain-containing protein [Patescibacteria group bacterium]|nr:HD domain-containing protein [Patescibacteria group bacterium]
MFSLPEAIGNIFKTLKKNHFEIYLVGGAVRDLLLNRKPENWDFTTNATPDDIQALFPDSFYHNKYGTVSIPVTIDQENKPSIQTIVEITPFRKETSYLDLRHPAKIEWAKTVEEDLKRRDFTINALAYDEEKIIDLFQGQDDLKNKLIRAIGDPDQKFQEDALRLIRAIRLAAQLGFLIEDKTRLSIEKNAQLITKISWERIRDEFLKILKTNHPAEGVLFLRNTKLLQYLLPELDVCFNIPQKSPKRHHRYDVGTHLVMSLKNCPSSDEITRFATLIHDIGKAQTFKRDYQTGIITFYNHEVVGEKLALKIAERFKLSNQKKEKLRRLVRYHQFTVSEKQTDKAIRRFIRQVGKEYLQDILDLRFADRIGSGAKPDSWRFKHFRQRLVEVQKEPFKVTDLAVDGYDVMKILGVKPGPIVGKVLNELFQMVVDKKLVNDREVLLKEIESFKTIKIS